MQTFNEVKSMWNSWLRQEHEPLRLTNWSGGPIPGLKHCKADQKAGGGGMGEDYGIHP